MKSFWKQVGAGTISVVVAGTLTACKSPARSDAAPADSTAPSTTLIPASSSEAKSSKGAASAEPVRKAGAKGARAPSDDTVPLPKTNSAKPFGAILSEVKLDKYEVTVESYRQCVDAGCCVAHCTPNGDGQGEALWNEYCNYDKEGRDKHPMNCVDWTNADAYCRWVGKRLPTDVEWAYAAYGDEARKYPWGNKGPDKQRANVCDASCRKALQERGRPWRAFHELDDGFPGTAPVGSFPDGASQFGALDMGGNVWEWVGDWFSPQPRLLPSKENPTGPASGERRVVRGGSWNDTDATELENQTRHGFHPPNRFVNVGFRCAELADDTAEPGGVCLAQSKPQDFKRSSCGVK